MKKIRSEKGRRSIKFNLIVIPLIIVFVAILGIGGISSYLIKDSMVEQMRENGLEIVAQVAD